MGIASWVVFGLVAGVVAKLLMPGRDPGLSEAGRAGLKGRAVPSLGHKDRQAASRE